MIVVDNLTKRYGDREVVKDVSFRVERGEILGFLGPNGAGKTTTMKMITGFLMPTTGSVRIGEVDMATDPIAAKSHIGYLPENPPVYPDMSVLEYLRFVGRINGLTGSALRLAVDEVIESCFLSEKRTKEIRTLSKGFQQRVGLAQAIIHKPNVLVLDEPTNGLDPNQIIQIRALIQGLAKERTVILSTHILQEVQKTCSRILIINRGTVVAEDTPDQLEAKARGRNVLKAIVRGPQHDVQATLSNLHGVLKAEVAADPAGFLTVQLETSKDVDLRERLAAEIVGRQWGLLELSSSRLSLEEVFINVTSQSAGSSSEDPAPEVVLTHG